MKTYQSGTNEKKKNFFKRHWQAFVAIISIVVIAAVVAVSVVFSLPDSEPVDVGTVNPPVEEVKPVLVMPMTGAQVGLEYANESLEWWDTLEVWKTHPGIDFVGEGDVVSIRDGVIADVEKTTLEGTVVTVTHDDGYVSVYKSLDEVTVKKGDSVRAGDKIGKAATSMSELNTGAHLHLEVKKDGKYVDPTTILPESGDK